MSFPLPVFKDNHSQMPIHMHRSDSETSGNRIDGSVLIQIIERNLKDAGLIKRR